MNGECKHISNVTFDAEVLPLPFRPRLRTAPATAAAAPPAANPHPGRAAVAAEQTNAGAGVDPSDDAKRAEAKRCERVVPCRKQSCENIIF